MDYAKDLYIDDSSLDAEIAAQPELMMKYCTISAEAQQAMDIAKEKLEFVRSELDQAIRKSPDTFGIEKITDKVVENTIPLQESYKIASREYIDAKFEFNVAKGAVESCSQRKDALEQLIKLFGLNYFAGPKVPRNLTQERQARMQKQDDSKITRERK
jgi:hypothetical protein